MTHVRPTLCALAALTLTLSACDSLGDDSGPSTIDQDVLTGDSSPRTARPTSADTDVTTATGSDLDAQTATGRPNDSDLSTSTAPSDSDLTTATASSTAQDSAEPAPTEAPADDDLPETALEAADGEASDNADLLSTTVRIGAHPDYDRVVFDLEGEGTPGYSVSYVDSAVEAGSGVMQDVGGDAILQVVITGTRYPQENEAYEGGPGTYSLEDAEEVEEVRLSGTFEGTTQAFIGVDDGGTPFRAFVLSDPARLVVDVAHDG